MAFGSLYKQETQLGNELFVSVMIELDIDKDQSVVCKF